MHRGDQHLLMDQPFGMRQSDTPRHIGPKAPFTLTKYRWSALFAPNFGLLSLVPIS